MPTARPVSAEEFSGLMARLGPFESVPRLAIAVSGGADSMALALLAFAWARARGGEAVALTVDHGLRPESADEARTVGAWMTARGIPHRVLKWQAAKPAAGIQEAARLARYRLLLEWCREAEILHLLLAHHRDDQAETVLLRLGRGSGVDGLAGMAPVMEAEHARLLRPMLGLPKARLQATLQAVGQEWIEDPSNRDPRFGRARVRALLAGTAEDVTVEGIVASASRMAATRRYFEQTANSLLVRQATLHPAGFAWCGSAVVEQADEIALRALARLLQCIGATSYAPRQERLVRLLAAMRGSGRGWTLAGCRILRRRGDFLICREAAAMEGEVAVLGDGPVDWDGRFRLSGGRGPDLRLGPLGADGWRRVAGEIAGGMAATLPAPVRPTLPALRDELGIFAVPHLGYKRDGGGSTLRSLVFRPPATLTVVARCLV